MKAFITNLQKNISILNILVSTSRLFAVVGANTCCCCLYHQPEKPDLTNMRKF